MRISCSNCLFPFCSALPFLLSASLFNVHIVSLVLFPSNVAFSRSIPTSFPPPRTPFLFSVCFLNFQISTCNQTEKHHKSRRFKCCPQEMQKNKSFINLSDRIDTFCPRELHWRRRCPQVGARSCELLKNSLRSPLRRKHCYLLVDVRRCSRAALLLGLCQFKSNQHV